MSDVEEEEEPESEMEGRGRSARKREVQGFDRLAEELLELTEAKCNRLPVTDELKQALKTARQTTAMKAKAARKRYIKHLASMLRDSEDEVTAIRNFLAGIAYTPVTGDEAYRDLDDARLALIDPQTYSKELERVCEQLPHIDLALVTRLAKRLHEGSHDKSYRLLYKELRRAADESDQDEEIES